MSTSQPHRPPTPVRPRTRARASAHTAASVFVSVFIALCLRDARPPTIYRNWCKVSCAQHTHVCVVEDFDCVYGGGGGDAQRVQNKWCGVVVRFCFHLSVLCAVVTRITIYCRWGMGATTTSHLFGCELITQDIVFIKHYYLFSSRVGIRTFSYTRIPISNIWRTKINIRGTRWRTAAACGGGRWTGGRSDTFRSIAVTGERL